MKEKIVLTDEQVQKIAMRRARGVSLEQLEQEFGMSRPVINRALASDAARSVTLDILRDDATLENAKNRSALAKLLPKAIEKLAAEIDKGNMKAIELALKGSGIMIQTEADKNGNKQAQQITVVLPGQVSTKEIKDVNTDF